NTLSGLKDKATPRDGNLRILICGPTVYDFSHLGHARILLFYDLVARYLMLSRMRTTAILNITDIDPKISFRAKEERSSAADISNKFINELLIDIQSLGINTLIIAKTSDYVETARKLILELLSEKRAYFANGNVYLYTSSLAPYRKLSRMNREDLVNRRVDIAPGKKNPNDILLWNGSDDFGQKYYDDSLGAGVPWWHIQDSSVAMSIFNGVYDLHGGATELVYPHHESIMAQLRMLTSNHQPVKIWNHVGLVNINGKKMSKSFGNIIRIRDLIRKYNSNIIRLYLFSKHYRRPFMFSQSELDKFYSVDETIASALWGDVGTKIPHRRTRLTNEFTDYIENDVNTPSALELMIETARKRKSIGDLRYMVRTFGLVY
ncbi:MAG TPA: class I tRNA ligase family protein, partial [Nitrososphaeraceae archaeon]|nr:class I tRNA ligase family protein [Nitrososphaeraceae archaeon]